MKKLTRDPIGPIGGICEGLGEYFNINPLFIRLLFIISSFFGLIGVLVYIFLWMIIPEKKI